MNGIWQGKPTAIENFPNESFQVKHMYWPVPQSGYAVLPVFPGYNPAPDPNDPTRPVKPVNPAKYSGYETWNQAVAVTAGKTTGETMDVSYAWPDFQNVPTVNVQDFYYTQIDQAAFDQLDKTDRCILNQSSNGVYGRDFAVGDYLITIGMHVMVREDADLKKSGLLPSAAAPTEVRNTWSMQTFWFDGAIADGGNKGRYSANQPTKDLKPGAWNNYAMCQSYDPVEPLEGDGKPHICSDPYIELVFPETYRAVASCATCHMAGGYPSAPSLTDTLPGRAHYNSEKRGAVPVEYYRALLFTDFSWAIPLSALPGN